MTPENNYWIPRQVDADMIKKYWEEKGKGIFSEQVNIALQSFSYAIAKAFEEKIQINNTPAKHGSSLTSMLTRKLGIKPYTQEKVLEALGTDPEEAKTLVLQTKRNVDNNRPRLVI